MIAAPKALSRFHPVRIIVAVAAGGVVLWMLVASHAFFYLTGRLLLATLLVQPLGMLGTIAVAARLSYLAGAQVSVWSAAKAQSLAVLLLYMLPSRLSEFVKPFYLANRCGITLSRALAAVFCERLFDLLTIAIATAVGVFYLAGGGLLSSAPYWIGIGMAVLAFGALLMARPHWFSCVIALLPGVRLKEILNKLLVDVSRILRPQVVLGTVALGVLGWASSYLSILALFWLAASKPLGPGDALIVLLASTMGLNLAVAPGGLGTYEGAIVLMLKYLGYGVGEGLALAVGMRITAMLLPVLVALFVLAHEHISPFSFVRNMRALWKKGAASSNVRE